MAMLGWRRPYGTSRGVQAWNDDDDDGEDDGGVRDGGGKDEKAVAVMMMMLTACPRLAHACEAKHL
eukprot:3564814-Rhodomonas_salina.2